MRWLITIAAGMLGVCAAHAAQASSFTTLPSGQTTSFVTLPAATEGGSFASLPETGSIVVLPSLPATALAALAQESSFAVLAPLETPPSLIALVEVVAEPAVSNEMVASIPPEYRGQEEQPVTIIAGGVVRIANQAPQPAAPPVAAVPAEDPQPPAEMNEGPTPPASELLRPAEPEAPPNNTPPAPAPALPPPVISRPEGPGVLRPL